jgi:predicted CopG family antitoxin
MAGKEVITTIQITQQTRDKLKDLGKKGETYEDVIVRLLKELKK